MVVFLAADARRYEELDDAVRQYLAWDNLADTEDRIREQASDRQSAQRILVMGRYVVVQFIPI